jgi:putative ABC transport system substrate-binding protein
MTLRIALYFALIIIAVSAPPTTHALGQDKIWRIGFLDLGTPPTTDRPSRNLEPFQRGLDELGYKEGRNYIIDARFADTDQSRLPALAKELVDRGVDVVVTIGTPTVRAAKQATATIPIVMAGSQNPVENGFITSLAHPGGNVTGLTHNPGPDLAGKALQLLKETAPYSSRVAILVALGGGFSSSVDVQRAIAGDLEMTLLVHDVSEAKSADDFAAILSKIMEERADALFAFAEFTVDKHKNALLDFVSTNKLPSMFQEARFVEEGGLMSYYTDFPELRRQAAHYVEKIFKGAKPADLPVEQPSRFELTINLNTAKVLGLTVPPSVLALAEKTFD